MALDQVQPRHAKEPRHRAWRRGRRQNRSVSTPIVITGTCARRRNGKNLLPQRAGHGLNHDRALELRRKVPAIDDKIAVDGQRIGQVVQDMRQNGQMRRIGAGMDMQMPHPFGARLQANGRSTRQGRGDQRPVPGSAFGQPGGVAQRAGHAPGACREKPRAAAGGGKA